MSFSYLPEMVQKFLLLQAHKCCLSKFLQVGHKRPLVLEHHIWVEWNGSLKVHRQRVVLNLVSEAIYVCALAWLQL
jgi:hypothetical protein